MSLMLEKDNYRPTRYTYIFRQFNCISSSGIERTIWGNGTETCIISYKKRIASPGLIQDAWGWCTGMTRRDGTGGGRGVQDREHTYACGRFMLMCGRNNTIL